MIVYVCALFVSVGRPPGAVMFVWFCFVFVCLFGLFSLFFCLVSLFQQR